MTSLLLLTAVVVLGIIGVAKPASARWPRFLSTGLHRNLALMSLVFLTIHIVTAVVDPFTHLGWLIAVVPFTSYYRTFWLGLGTLAFDLLLAVAITSWVRNFIGHKLWRGVHWLTYAAWPVALLHGLGTGTDAGGNWLQGITWGCALVVFYAIIYRVYRVGKGVNDPLLGAKENYRLSASAREE